MSDLPEDLRYTKEHEWARSEENGSLTIGITHHAQESLGDITFVELPEIGSRFTAGEVFGVVESVKAASDLFAPFTGEVVAVNEELDLTPEMVNETPYAEGWMIKVKPDDPNAINSLLLAAEYSAGL